MTIKNHYNRNKKGAMSLRVRLVGFVLCMALLGVIAYYMWQEYNQSQAVYQEPAPEQVQTPPPVEEPAPEEPEGPYYPVGTLLDTPERNAYADGDIVLKVASMGVEGPVLDGVTDEVLENGVGLFDQAQLPGPMERNGNVSIAGHRDIYGQEFYHIDKVEIGDDIRLLFRGNTYIYTVEQSFVTDKDDWTPILVREYPCVTLQSCTPIGTAEERIFVVGRLTDILSGDHLDDAGGAAPDSDTDSIELPSGDRIALDTDEPSPI